MSTDAGPHLESDWDALVAAALADICDPCSLAAGAPLSLVDMGLLRSCSYDDGVLTVRLGVTGPGCTFFGAFGEAARLAVAALPGVREARVVIDTTTVWDESRMTAAGSAVLAARRLRTLELSGVRPRMWQEQS